MSKGKTKIYNFRFGDDLIAEIDRWRAEQDIEPTRTDVIKLALERFFRAEQRPKQRAAQKVSQ